MRSAKATSVLCGPHPWYLKILRKDTLGVFLVDVSIRTQPLPYDFDVGNNDGGDLSHSLGTPRLTDPDRCLGFLVLPKISAKTLSSAGNEVVPVGERMNCIFPLKFFLFLCSA